MNTKINGSYEYRGIRFKEKCFKRGVIVHCSTQDEANKFLAWADSLNLTWCSEESYENTNWGVYRKGTCYHLWSGGFSELSSYTDYSFEILSFQEALSNEIIVGEIVRVRSNDDEWINGELLAILPEDISSRYITRDPNDPTKARSWDKAIPVPVEPIIEEMTLDAICKELGRDIKVVK